MTKFLTPVLVIKVIVILAKYFSCGLVADNYFGGIKSVTKGAHWMVFFSQLLVLFYCIGALFVYITSSVIINVAFSTLEFKPRFSLIVACIVVFYIGFFVG